MDIFAVTFNNIKSFTSANFSPQPLIAYIKKSYCQLSFSLTWRKLLYRKKKVLSSTRLWYVWGREGRGGWWGEIVGWRSGGGGVRSDTVWTSAALSSPFCFISFASVWDITHYLCRVSAVHICFHRTLLSSEASHTRRACKWFYSFYIYLSQLSVA